MGKGKPRHNPDKPQNKMGGFCPRYETYSSCNIPYCEGGSCDDAKSAKATHTTVLKHFTLGSLVEVIYRNRMEIIRDETT